MHLVAWLFLVSLLAVGKNCPSFFFLLMLDEQICNNLDQSYLYHCQQYRILLQKAHLHHLLKGNFLFSKESEIPQEKNLIGQEELQPLLHLFESGNFHAALMKMIGM
jgi:hypothetical protein